jgi:hypothetical protein
MGKRTKDKSNYNFLSLHFFLDALRIYSQWHKNIKTIQNSALGFGRRASMIVQAVKNKMLFEPWRVHFI